MCLPARRKGDKNYAVNATADVYGRKLTAREIVMEGRVGVPASGRDLVRVLDWNSPFNESKVSADNK